MLGRLLSLLLPLWLGLGAGVAYVAIPHVFSPAVRDALPPGGAGRIAQGILLRTFQAQAVVATLALALHAATRRGGALPGTRQRDVLLPVLLAASLAALFWLHPSMSAWFEAKYDAARPAAERELAGRRFAAWHGASQAGNLLVLMGVLACSWKLAHPRGVLPPQESKGHAGVGNRGAG